VSGSSKLSTSLSFLRQNSICISQSVAALPDIASLVLKDFIIYISGEEKIARGGKSHRAVQAVCHSLLSGSKFAPHRPVLQHPLAYNFSFNMRDQFWHRHKITHPCHLSQNGKTRLSDQTGSRHSLNSVTGKEVENE